MMCGGENMPKRNGTGPNGLGSLTGKGLGNCHNSTTTSTDQDNLGRGLGRGTRKRASRNGQFKDSLTQTKDSNESLKK